MDAPPPTHLANGGSRLRRYITGLEEHCVDQAARIDRVDEVDPNHFHDGFVGLSRVGHLHQRPAPIFGHGLYVLDRRSLKSAYGHRVMKNAAWIERLQPAESTSTRRGITVTGDWLLRSGDAAPSGRTEVPEGWLLVARESPTRQAVAPEDTTITKPAMTRPIFPRLAPPRRRTLPTARFLNQELVGVRQNDTI